MLRKNGKNVHDDPSSNNFNSIEGNLINQSEKKFCERRYEDLIIRYNIFSSSLPFYAPCSFLKDWWLETSEICIKKSIFFLLKGNLIFVLCTWDNRETLYYDRYSDSLSSAGFLVLVLFNTSAPSMGNEIKAILSNQNYDEI